MKLREQFAEGLTRMGYTRIQGRTEKYWVFQNSDVTIPHREYAFLGKAGAVRFNTKNRISDSLAASDRSKNEILKAAGAK